MNLPKLTREALTVSEAAEVLSESVYQQHTDADIYRLALDGRLALSIDLPPTPAREGPTVEWAQSAVESFLGHEADRGFGGLANVYAVGGYAVDTFDEDVVARGLWDAWLVGTARTCVEAYWQMLTGRPFSCTQFFNWGTHCGGLVIVHEPNSATYCRLYGLHAGERFPLIEFPSGSQYAVRTEPLKQLIEEINAPNRPQILGSKQNLQEQEIKRYLVHLDYDPMKLPRPRGAAGGPKKRVREALAHRKDLFQTPVVFNKAWDRLKELKEIRDIVPEK